MLFLSRRIQHPLDVTVQGPHDADAREHRRAVLGDDQKQGLDRILRIADADAGLLLRLEASFDFCRGLVLQTTAIPRIVFQI
jgi:hypothetical protein